MNVTAYDQLPNSDSVKELRRETSLLPAQLKEARLMDLGLERSYDDVMGKFIVEAKTGVAVWAWLDIPGKFG